ncbi:hypothetical protein pdam_00024314, partial [Pocillopora damicornis]
MKGIDIDCDEKHVRVTVIWNVRNTAQGKYCYSYESLNIAELKRGNCQQIKNATSQHWLKADCKIRSSGGYRKRDFALCLQLWCDYFSICLHQTTEWKNYCSLKFYRLRSYCYSYESLNIPELKKVPPCLNTALWKQSSNTCNYLKNGTNNIWYTVGLGYHSSLRWCDAFRNCYGSNDLRNRCRRDFDFYFRFPPTFTVEILSYLPHARIQVNYVCSGRYIFAVNVIRCNSESKRNDSLVVKNDNDDSDDDNAEAPQTLNSQSALDAFEETLSKFSNGTFGNQTEEEKMEAVFQATYTLEQFVLEYAQYHLNKTTPNLSINSQEIGQGSYDFVNYRPQKGNETACFGTQQIAGFSALVVTLSLSITASIAGIESFVSEKYNKSSVGWSGQGCSVKYMDESQTECSCNHLTHFAVLMQFGTEPYNEDLSETDNKILEILTYMGLTLSLIGITMTILGYVFLTEMRGPLSQIRVSLVASLGAAQIIFLGGIGATENKKVCVMVAALEQFFLTAAFCWMFIEGVYLYLFVVKVYNVTNKMKICHGATWGFSALVVTLSLSITAGIAGIESFVSEKYCWLSNENGLIWIFLVFVLLIGLLNIMILVRVIREMTTMQQTKDNQTEQIRERKTFLCRLGIRACVVMIPLLGVTWLFGVLLPLHKAFAYILTIFNSTQVRFYDFPPALLEKHGGIISLFRLKLLVSQGWLIFIFFLSMEKPFFSLLILADKKSTQEKAPFHFPISRQWN